MTNPTLTGQDPDILGGSTPAPDSLDMRMAAEWASGVRAETLYFTWNHTLELTTSPTALGPVQTSDDVSQRPALSAVSFSIEGVEEALIIPGSTVDALFWSESAVEKFLFPYYASMTAYQGTEFLAKLVRAWQGYSGTDVQVVALAHTCGPNPPLPGVPLTPENTLAVVFAPVVNGVPGTLQMLSLDAFMQLPVFGSTQGQPIPLSPPTGTLGSVPLTPGTGSLASIPCRELAEFASGIRGQSLAIAREGDELNVSGGSTTPPSSFDAENPVLYTDLHRPDRPGPVSVYALVNGDWMPLVGPDATQLPTPPDSLFWTDAAVEKLLMPYYASVKGRYAPWFVTLLMGTWDGLTPPGAPGSTQLAIETLEKYASEPPSTRETEVFGLVHLPRSEYVIEGIDDRVGIGSSGSVALENRTRVLTWSGGTFSVKPLGGS